MLKIRVAVGLAIATFTAPLLATLTEDNGPKCPGTRVLGGHNHI